MIKLFIALMFLPIFTMNDNIKSGIFIWNNTTIEVPLNADLTPYLDIPYASLAEGYEDNSIWYEKNGVNYTFVSTINTSIVKSYKLYFRVHSPKYKKSSTVEITIKIVDNVPPKIIKMNPVEVPVGIKSIDYKKSISYEDNYDSLADLTLIVMDEHVNLNRVGSYPVWIKLVDLSLNETISEITVEVKDYLNPTVTEIKNPVLNIGEDHNLMTFYSIQDNYTVSLEINIDDSLVDYTSVGKYPFSIQVVDSSGNSTVYESFVEIMDNEAPLIFFSSGSQSIVLDTFFDPKSIILKVSDNHSKLTKEDVIIETDLDTKTVGYYDVVYTLMDHSNNKSEYIIELSVVDKEKPSVSSNKLLSSTVDIDLLKGVTCIDNTGFCEIRLVEHNIEDEEGIYQALYLVVDKYGNHTYHTRTIEIQKGITTSTNSSSYGAVIILGLSVLGILYFGLSYYMKRKQH